jgi:hypothetical protein
MSGSARDQIPQTDSDFPPRADGALDPIDRDWIARRSAVAPLVLGAVSVVLSPLLLGLLFGPLGMRAGIDLWKHGTRRAAVVAAIALGFAGTVASIMGALLWGSILASVLLGRDAMREAERWTGRDVAAAVVEFRETSDRATPAPRSLGALDPNAERWAILFCDEGSEPCIEAATTLAECASRAPKVVALAVAPDDSIAPLDARLRLQGVELRVAAFRAVAPLDAVAAFPTFIVVDRSGRIEKALVGAHPAADIDALLAGGAALPESAPDAGARRP